MTTLEETNLIIQKEEENERIDKLLSSRFAKKSRNYFQYLIQEGCVFRNGEKVRKRDLLKEGDEIEVFFRLSPELSLEPENIPLDILFEDEHILVVNKPAGMVVHPAPGNWNQTFVNALLHHCQNLPTSQDESRPGIVHRLDKNTSGILIAAKTTLAHQKLIEAFQEKKIEKTYLAICIGKPPNGVIQQPIGRDPRYRKKMRVSEEGKPAQTKCHILAFNDKMSLVQLNPITGRTHQLRVHMKYCKTPILGDEVYGNASLNKAFEATRQCLHAYQIKLSHPVFQTPLHFVAPLPNDLKKWILQISAETPS